MKSEFHIEPAPVRTFLPALLLFVLLTIAAVFGLYEVLERTWLEGADQKLIHTLHMIRGVLSSILVAFVVGWFILKNWHPLLPEKASQVRWPSGIRESEKEGIEYFARWFIQMRWVATLFAFTLVFVAVKITSVLPEEVWWPLAVTTSVLVAMNLIFLHLLRKGRIRHLLPVQVYSDLLVLTALLHFSGGIENPLSLLPIIHIIVAGILLSKRQCYTVAAAAGALFAAMAWAEWGHWIEHYTLLIFPHGEGEAIHVAHQAVYVASRTGLQLGLLLLVAYFVTMLAEQSREHKRRSEQMAENALAERQLLEQALETTRTGVRVVNMRLEPVWTNHWWKEWFSECAARNDSSAESAVCNAEKQTLEDGIIRVTEVIAGSGSPAQPSPSGAPSVYHVTTAPLADRQGRIGKVVHLAQDITEQKLNQARMMHAGKLAAIGELASNVAHEVNNPIAVISAKARLLLSDYRQDLTEKVRSDLEKIVHLSDRVAHIAQGLLSYCRPSAALRTSLDVRLPIRRALAIIEERARTSNVQIVDSLHDCPKLVWANFNEMEQIFLNLFLNALDAMPEEGKLTISCNGQRLGDVEGGLEIIVEDTGNGIPEEIRERVFEPFFTTKEDGRGTGLGLSICLGLIRSHGGEIEIRSIKPKGTQVVVRLPAASEGHSTDGTVREVGNA